jgi:hypothetical protein
VSKLTRYDGALFLRPLGAAGSRDYARCHNVLKKPKRGVLQHLLKKSNIIIPEPLAESTQIWLSAFEES